MTKYNTKFKTKHAHFHLWNLLLNTKKSSEEILKEYGESFYGIKNFNFSAIFLSTIEIPILFNDLVSKAQVLKDQYKKPINPETIATEKNRWLRSYIFHKMLNFMKACIRLEKQLDYAIFDNIAENYPETNDWIIACPKLKNQYSHITVDSPENIWSSALGKRLLSHYYFLAERMSNSPDHNMGIDIFTNHKIFSSYRIYMIKHYFSDHPSNTIFDNLFLLKMIMNNSPEAKYISDPEKTKLAFDAMFFAGLTDFYKIGYRHSPENDFSIDTISHYIINHLDMFPENLFIKFINRLTDVLIKNHDLNFIHFFRSLNNNLYECQYKITNSKTYELFLKIFINLLWLFDNKISSDIKNHLSSALNKPIPKDRLEKTIARINPEADDLIYILNQYRLKSEITFTFDSFAKLKTYTPSFRMELIKQAKKLDEDLTTKFYKNKATDESISNLNNLKLGLIHIYLLETKEELIPKAVRCFETMLGNREVNTATKTLEDLKNHSGHLTHFHLFETKVELFIKSLEHNNLIAQPHLNGTLTTNQTRASTAAAPNSNETDSLDSNNSNMTPSFR
jgi:hypothetical protein